MIRTRAMPVSISLLLLCAGCTRTHSTGLGMPDSTFVATLNDLRQVDTDTTLDATMRDSTRRLILRRHKVTSDQLEHAAAKLANTPTRASDLWRKVETPPRQAKPTAAGILTPAATPRP